jgi:pyruvate formate lyase activating enzyme
MQGRIHSFQSLGTVDGPGVRAVVFMQGCPLRCVCCHNPDTWDFEGGTLTTPEQMASRVRRLKAYFGKDGGLTVSGGEPLMQPEFVTELFRICKSEGIGCALDTSGCVYNDKVEELLGLCDIVLLDYKYTNAEDYTEKCGCSIEQVDLFLGKLQKLKKRVWLRQVIIPGLTDSEESVERLYSLKERFDCIEKIELLPFRKLCIEKYKAMDIEFPLADTPEADPLEVARLQGRMEK